MIKLSSTFEVRKRETRLIAREMRIKRSASGDPVLEGYASVFNTLSEDLGGFKEQILPGAFTTSLDNCADVRCLRGGGPVLVRFLLYRRRLGHDG